MPISDIEVHINEKFEELMDLVKTQEKSIMSDINDLFPNNILTFDEYYQKLKDNIKSLTIV